MKSPSLHSIREILEKMGFSSAKDTLSAVAFTSEEDGAPYAVWRIDTAERTYVLKQAKGDEPWIYSTYLNIESPSVPRLYAVAHHEEHDYLLTEFVSGKSLLALDKANLPQVLDALIDLQRRYWGTEAPSKKLEDTYARRIARGRHLNDATLEAAYEGYLQQFQSLPRTLCHDDLLPFNVIFSEERAVLIDWEVAGILPYPTPLARLLAHGEDSPDAFFYLTNEDRAFAVDYYYENLIREMGISYEEYRRGLDFCFFYEYCEWVMLGNKYGDTETERFKRYLALSKDLAKTLIQ